MSGTTLNGPVLDSVPTPTDKGYYMVASDGGMFSFGDARFFGSMGGKRLNAPVQSLVPDGDAHGYWLVASDGGISAFDAPFRGSMGGIRLNKPDIDFASWSDARLTEAARSFVESIFPELAGHLAASHLTRWAYAAHKGNVGSYPALDLFMNATRRRNRCRSPATTCPSPDRSPPWSRVSKRPSDCRAAVEVVS